MIMILKMIMIMSIIMIMIMMIFTTGDIQRGPVVIINHKIKG